MDLRSKIARTGRRLLHCASLWTLFLTLSASAADPKSDGLTALKQGDFRKAYTLLLQAVEVAKNEKDDKTTADLLFYLGLCLQESGGRENDRERRAQLLGEAAIYYNQALGLQPRSSSKILNNLAQIYISQGATKLAQETLIQAIALGDENQAFHMQNYGDLLLAGGGWKEACRFYGLALWTQPDNAAVLKKLVDACMRKNPALLGTYLWDMTERGQILQAQEVALSVLSGAHWGPDQKDELLAIVAVCLSKQTYDRREFSRSDTGRRLQKLSEEVTSIAGGVREILQLHETDNFRREDFRWWREKRNERFQRPERGKWPLQALQELIRSTGEYYKTKGEPKVAENYFRLAIDLHEMAPDIPSLLALADLYARTDRQKALRDLVRANEHTLFGEKARYYQQGKLNEIYVLHRALGSIYSYLKQWGRSSDPASAIFQLEHALIIARKTQAKAEGKPIEFEPELVERLAVGYQETNQTPKAFALRLEIAEELHEAGKNEAAATIFAPIQRSTPPKTLKTRYDLMRANLDSRSDSTSLEKSKDRKPEVRVSAKSQSIEGNRQEEKLTDNEIADIQTSLANLFKKERPEKNEAKTIQLLSPEEVPKEVKEIELEGVHGRVVLEKNAKSFEVPFTVDSNASLKGPKTRYIQP